MAKNIAKPLNVFIGCPGDMAPERDALLASRDHIESVVCPVKFRTWKMSASGVGEAQRVIFENDPVESFDVVIILLWSRLGVPSGIHDPVTLAEMTGTEAEFVAAYDLHKKSGKRSPQVLLYRCARNPEIDMSSPKLPEQLAQLQAVQQFFKQTENGGLRPMLPQSFKTAEELKDMVTRDLKVAAERLGALETEPQVSIPPPPLATTPPSSGETLQLHRYFANLRDQFAIYENLGLPIPERDGKEGEKDQPVPIRDLFVAPTCIEAHFRPEAFDAALREGKNPAKPLLPRLAPAKSCTVLLADPGMGKSTLIQWLVSILADEAVPPGAEALRGAIPLPFILRDLVGHLPQEVKDWNWDALMDAFRQWRHHGKGAPLAAPLTADEAIFRSKIASANAFFLIDGLDEIGDPQRRLAIRNAIWEGLEKYPNARWLITSRIVGYEQAEVHQRVFTPEEVHTDTFDRELRMTLEATDFALARLFANCFYLAPFDNTQQLAFARNWYVPRLGDAAGTQRADDFIAAVHRNDHTRVISRVPNLLYLLALLFRHRARLPDGRALVYAAISSAYLADIDLGRHLPDSLIVPWKFEEKEDLLALVAMRMQEIRVAQAKDKKGKKDDGDAKDARGEILVTRAQLEEWLGPRFKDAKGAVDCTELNRFLNHIADRSGLLLPRGEGVFGFAHLSFQEYYAACYLEKEFQRILVQNSPTARDDIFGTPLVAAKQDEEKMFAEMAAQTAWHEPLLFLVEKLRHSAPYTSRILGWTFPQLATEPKIENEADAYNAVKTWMPFNVAQLLAGISLDQEVTLNDEQRAKIWRSLWQAHIAMFDVERIYGGWNIAPFLIVAGSTYHTVVLEAAAALKPTKFHIYQCTAANDIAPLSGMYSLERLWLICCTAVSDLKPLARLVLLSNLSLAGCTAVSDLAPLASLFSLSRLILTNCTAVSDLKPLASLTFLNYLNLDGCTAVSDAEVDALQKKLPKLQIKR